MKKILITYYANLREERGVSNETLETDGLSAKDLFLNLKSQYNFTLGIDACRVAINDEFVDWTTELNDGDKLVFIPPVAGG